MYYEGGGWLAVMRYGDGEVLEEKHSVVNGCYVMEVWCVLGDAML